MATIVVTKTYSDGGILFEADLDAVKESIETFLNITKINDDNLQNNGIDAGTKLVNATVTSNKLASNSVITSKITDASVTEAKLAANSVSTAKIIDLAVTAAKVAENAVTVSKLAQRPTVTTDGSDPGLGGIATRAISQTRTTTGAYTNKVTLTVSGKGPVLITFNTGQIVLTNTGSATSKAAAIEFRIFNSSIFYSAFIGYVQGAAGMDLNYPASAFQAYFFPTASGALTFEVTMETFDSQISVAIDATLLAMEIL